ncbi:hypothetical protein CEQ90_18780 [Lewinellaceae bacterium SD302]|nr:hypothetical protein CEQ90_18780 [Lewinellaceae bacterium SD302]
MPRSKAFEEKLVLEKARDLFWERGYAATSIQDLEKATGIRRSSIYNAFGGKRELFNRTLKAYQSFNQDVLQKFLSTATLLRPALIELFERIIGLPVAERKGCYVVNATTELAAVDAEVLRFAAENRMMFTSLLKSALGDALHRGEIKADSDLEAQANYLFVWYNGLQVASQTGMPGNELRKAVKLAIAGLEWEVNDRKEEC